MPTTLTRKDASTLLRTKIIRDDANDFEKTESSDGAPLKVKTSTNLTLDEKRILSLDASLRRSETRTDASDETGLIPPGYKVPETRTITRETIDKAFANRNEGAAADLLEKIYSLYPSLVPTGANVAPLNPPATLSDLAAPIKSLDFAIDVKGIFSQLDNPEVIYVDAPGDPYVSVHIVGKASDGLVVAQSLLVQT
jgi:hypothetical protein